jgi:hypothetical protein
MADLSNFLKTARRVWSQVKGFATLWLALVSLGGFLVLVGGPWVLGLLTKLFGPAAAKPGRVITLDMLFTLPFSIYFWVQQGKLTEDSGTCSQCGQPYPKTNSSCPACGCANSANEQPQGDTLATTKP